MVYFYLSIHLKVSCVCFLLENKAARVIKVDSLWSYGIKNLTLKDQINFKK